MPDEDITPPVTQAATEDAVDRPEVAPEVDLRTDDDDSAFDDRAKSALAKVRREAANLRARVKELEPAAVELKQIRDKDKTESQRLSDELAAMNKKLAAYELREVRSAAAVAAGLPLDMAQFITASDPAEAKAQAKQLADWGKTGGGSADFKQGARPNTPAKLTGDDMLRRMAGRQ